MKKILCVFLVLLVLMSATLPVAAAEKTWQEIIFEEVVQLVDIEKYAANDKDKNIYLLSLIETGYGEKGFEDGNALYLYLYNPSRKEIKQSDLNQIQMAIGWDDAKEKPVKFKKYPIKLEGSTMNGLYLRCKVDKVTAKELALVKDGTRKYGITEIELVDHGEFMGEAYEVGYSFEFSGYGEDRKGNRESFLTLELDVGHTSRVTGPSATDGYYNQIASVYFSVPEEVEKEYGLLYDIDYQYARYRTQPMIITEDEELVKLLESLMGDTYLPGSDWPVSMYHDEVLSTANYHYYRYFYGEWLEKTVGSGTSWIYYLKANDYTPKFNIVLQASTLNEGERAVASEDIEAYFRNYTDDRYPYGISTVMYKKYGFLPDLFVDGDTDRMQPYHHTRKDLFDIPSYGDNHKWWESLFSYGTIFPNNVGEDVKDIKYIQSLVGVDLTADDFCEKYYVGEADLQDLETYVQKAAVEDESVYLLRFAYSDQYSYNFDLQKGEGVISTNIATYENESGETIRSEVAIVQEDVYLGFDILRLGFSDDGEDITTFGVVMSPVNIIPSLDNGSKPNSNNNVSKVDWLRLIVAALALLVLIIAIFRLPGLIASISHTSANLQMRKYYKNKNRYNRRR